LFRIDRSLVKVSGLRINRFDADEKTEVGAEDATTSVSPIEDYTSRAEAMVNEYLSAAEAEMNEKVEKILDDAREQAATIIFQAREDAEEQRAKGWQEGFEEGSAKGRQHFDDELNKKINEDDEALKRVLDEIYDERERTYNELEDEVTKLSLEIVRKIINPSEDELGTVFLSQIKNALRQMATDGKIIIRVGASEYERFFSSGAVEIELDSGTVVKAAVMRDVSLEDGDLIIDTDDVTINAGLNSQLQYVKLSFERANQYEP